MAGSVCIYSQFSDHIVYHLVHPLTSEALEVVQEGVFVVAGALLLAELAGHELKDDLLVHFGSIVVVVHEDVTHL